MGVTERIWGALTAVIKLEDKVDRQGEIIRSQQLRLEELTARMIRVEVQSQLLHDLVARGAGLRQIRSN